MKQALNSPFVILPLTAVFLGLSLVPFAVWDTDHAAAFYGAFIASILAATAAFSGYFIQNKLSVEREEKAAAAKHIAEIVELFFWLRYIQVSLIRAERVIDKRLNQEEQPPDETTPFFQLNKVARKTIMLSGLESETRSHAAKALRLPPKARIVVAGRMYDICELAENLRSFFDRPLDYEFTLKNLSVMKNIILKHKERFGAATKMARDYLEKRGAFEE